MGKAQVGVLRCIFTENKAAIFIFASILMGHLRKNRICSPMINMLLRHFCQRKEDAFMYLSIF